MTTGGRRGRGRRDEVLRGQDGNNNVWCQDNALGWFDWDLVERNGDFLRFVRGLIALRKRHPNLQRRHFLSGRVRDASSLPDIAWHGVDLDAPQWLDKGCRALAFTLAPREAGEGPLHVMFNMGSEPVVFGVPDLALWRWHLAVDTGRAAPSDVVEPANQTPFPVGRCPVGAHSIVVLEGR